MKQAKVHEVRLTRADLIAYIAERDRQRQSSTGGKVSKKSSLPEGLRYCMNVG